MQHNHTRIVFEPLFFIFYFYFSVLQIQRLSFYDQIECFKKTKESIKAKIGGRAANKLCNEALYFIGLGRHALTIECIGDSAPFARTKKQTIYLWVSLQAVMTMSTIIYSPF